MPGILFCIYSQRNTFIKTSVGWGGKHSVFRLLKSYITGSQWYFLVVFVYGDIEECYLFSRFDSYHLIKLIYSDLKGNTTGIL